MSEEVERISKKEINRFTDDKTYKPDVNLRKPKHKPYKRPKGQNNWDDWDEYDEEW